MSHTATSVVVTVDNGRKRRYVVASEDEHLFAGVPTGPINGGKVEADDDVFEVRWAREDALGRFSFGCQWLRGMGRVDEMYRTLSTWEIVKVERIDATRVWGRG